MIFQYKTNTLEREYDIYLAYLAFKMFANYFVQLHFDSDHTEYVQVTIAGRQAQSTQLLIIHFKLHVSLNLKQL